MIAALPDVAVISNHERAEYAEIIACFDAIGYKSNIFNGSIYMKGTKWSEEGFTVYL